MSHDGYSRKIEIPAAMRERPIDHRGFPVPWFVTEKTDDGHWDFIRIASERFAEAVSRDVCWVSGKPLGQYRSFVIGPMCVVNRVSGDPPVKRSIGKWSARVCPFLSRPLARRDRSIDPEDYKSQRGVMLERNPGVCAIYTVRTRVRPEGGLFHLPDPETVEWFAKGRPATREEVLESMCSGLTSLAKIAAEQGDEALAELAKAMKRAGKLLPEASEYA